MYEIEVDDITSFKLKGQDREYKHYELLKVGEVQKNPFARVATSHDVEQNLEAARKNLKGVRSSAERRPSTRFEEFTRKDVAPKRWSRGPSSSQKEQVEQLKNELVGTVFLDEGIRWKIVDVKWNGKYKQIMVYYYDISRYDKAPPLRNILLWK